MSEVINADELENMLRGIKIPSPPQIIADLQMEMAMPDPDLNAMTSLIANDAGLSGAVLKVVNSPYYGGRGSVSSIPHAAMVLGMKSIVEIVNTICLKNETLSLDEVSDDMYATMIRFWDSATDVAKACRMVAKKIHLSPLDEVYTLGLFHNVGIPLMISKYDNYLSVMRSSYEPSNKRIVDRENDTHGTNHAVLGYYTARSWKLDEKICKVIAQHHNIDIFCKGNLDDSKENIMLALLKIAEHLVGLHRVLGNQHQDYEWDLISEGVLMLTGLSQYDLEDLVEEAKELGLGQQEYFR